MLEITMTIPDQCVGILGSTPDEAAARQLLAKGFHVEID